MEEKGLKVVSNLTIPPPHQEEKEFDVFFGSYSLTDHSIALVLQAQLGSEIWIADSRANQHCCNNQSLFLTYEIHALMIGIGNGATISPGRGSVELSLGQSSTSFLNILLTDVRHTPSSMLNMISEDKLEQHGIY